MKVNKLKKVRKEFSKYEIIRKPGQRLSDNDKKWILNDHICDEMEFWSLKKERTTTAMARSV